MHCLQRLIRHYDHPDAFFIPKGASYLSLVRGFSVSGTRSHLDKLGNATKSSVSWLIKWLDHFLMDENQTVALSPPKPNNGRILLAGSGPGHPSLLTLATHDALTKHADIVLSDKLVPASILQLIPPHVELRIARKFPGNEHAAQKELMETALEAANRGLTVVRLKQGDPMVYARVGEELAYFRSHGYAPLIIPGVSSAVAAPACAGIAITHRGVANSFIVCTGAGANGKAVCLPGYDRARTVLLLMGVARLKEVVHALLEAEPSRRRDGPAYPPYIPIAIIERGSQPDQRVLVSTVQDVVDAFASVGAQRPPGMIVIGWAVLAFGRRDGMSDVGEGLLDDAEVETEELERRDQERIVRWLGDRKWDVWEGLEAGWADFDYLQQISCRDPAEVRSTTYSI